MSKKSLTDVVKLSRPEKEKKLNDVLALMRKTKTGKEVLASMEKTGFKCSIETGIGNVFGFCDTDKKKIALNAVVENETLAAVLSHEILHAVQFGKDPTIFDTDRTRVSDTYKKQRGMEADACAHQAAFVYEAKKAGIAVEMPSGYEPIFETYSKEIEKTKNKKQAMNAAFKAWYKSTPIMDWYDNFYKTCISDAINNLICANVKTRFKGNVTDEHLANVFDYKGKPYVEPEFFSSPEAYCLKQSDKRKVMSDMKLYSKITGAPLDTSVLGMATRDETRKAVQSKRKNQAKSNKSAATAALIASKTKQR
ncbi:MAG TPA: hypothetical protein DF364_05675 [Ruminococcaceae bacterium]|nr:hypothetical protein [Oscillospiraceae bacterium]